MQLSKNIKDPRKLASEVYKALKFEGEVFLTVPFMSPYHEARIDLNLWTQKELEPYDRVHTYPSEYTWRPHYQSC
jgi:hypothetical protein